MLQSELYGVIQRDLDWRLGLRERRVRRQNRQCENGEADTGTNDAEPVLQSFLPRPEFSNYGPLKLR
jgi:hypothetical protein